jgi:putative Holliday junction resolvase
MPKNSMKISGRILCVDWGKKNLGLAISDPTRTIARPLKTIHHESRNLDASRIINIAKENEVNMILIGISYDDEGDLTSSGRSAERLARELEQNTNLPVVRIDEGFSTNEAKEAAIEMNLQKGKRKGHLDEIAAALILQRYLERERNEE